MPTFRLVNKKLTAQRLKHLSDLVKTSEHEVLQKNRSGYVYHTSFALDEETATIILNELEDLLAQFQFEDNTKSRHDHKKGWWDYQLYKEWSENRLAERKAKEKAEREAEWIRTAPERKDNERYENKDSWYWDEETLDWEVK